LGLVLIGDLALRLPQLTEFYTDLGILPRNALIALFGSPWLISLHFASGVWVVQMLLFLVALVVAIGFTVGYRTRLCAVVSWLLLLSMHARNPFILHGGDAVLRLLLFWSIFVPVNGRFSLDRALNPTAASLPVRHLSPGSLALVFQICGIYWFAAAEKMHPVWITELSAVYYALSLDQFATPLGKVLLDFPLIMSSMTFGTVILEMFGPLLAILPFYTTQLRLLVVSSFIGFHLGLVLTMWLDLFPWVCMAAWLAFLPGQFWERIRAILSASQRRPLTIFIDGTCMFCRQAVLILRQALGLQATTICEAQGDSEAHEIMTARRSWVVLAEGRYHTGYSAFLQLLPSARGLAWLAPILGLWPYRLVGERVYRWFSGHRQIAARWLAALIPETPAAMGRVGSVFVLAFLLLATSSFLDALPGRRSAAGSVTAALVYTTMLDQSWKMFAPYPTREDGWFVIEGLTSDGRRIDIWRGGGGVTDSKPQSFRRAFHNTQWLAYLAGLRRPRNREYRPYFGRYLCRQWNERHTGRDRVELIGITYMLEVTPPPSEPVGPAVPEPVWHHPCPA
jgi:predicted DCC family thiol-disulfide oxidoreductase YuxK